MKYQYQTIYESFTVETSRVAWSYSVPTNMTVSYADSTLKSLAESIKGEFRVVKEKSLNYSLRTFCRNNSSLYIQIKDDFLMIYSYIESLIADSNIFFSIDSEKYLIALGNNDASCALLRSYISSMYISNTVFFMSRKNTEYTFRYFKDTVTFKDGLLSIFCSCNLKHEGSPDIETSLTFIIDSSGNMDVILPELKNVDSKKLKKELIKNFLESLIIVI